MDANFTNLTGIYYYRVIKNNKHLEVFLMKEDMVISNGIFYVPLVRKITLPFIL